MKASLLLAIQFVALVTRYVAAFHFVTLGDWGDDNEDQYRTARGMSRWCRSVKCNAIISTGDNFYPSGVESVEDTRFNTTWRDVYNLTGIHDKYWLITMGNHDHKDNFQAQIDYSKIEPRWHLPSLWYDETFLNGTIHIICIDTDSIEKKKNDYKKQIQWLEKTLSQSTSPWKIVIGHHPPFSGGLHAPGSDVMREKIVPLLEKYRVDVLLNGHDHNLQHITKLAKLSSASSNKKDEWKIDYVITGAGGRELYPKDKNADKDLKKLGYQINYFKDQFGFITFNFDGKKELNVQFVHVTVSEENHVKYSFNRTRNDI